MPRRVASAVLIALVCGLGLVAAGCASTSILPGHGRGGSCAGHAHQDGPAAPAAQVEVVCRWSAALKAGHVRAAAGYFALPSVFENGPGQVLALHTLAQAEAVNATLSCGSQVISAFRHGRYINVLFRLVARAGPGGGASACGSGIGLSARTEFVIRDGHIAQWLRVPSRPGDPGTSGNSGNSGNTGSTV